MNKLFTLFIVVFTLISSLFASISNSEENTWLARNWLSKGNGWAERGIIRTSANDKGSFLIGVSSDSTGNPYVVSLDIKAELNISRFNIEAWEFSEATTLDVPIPVPEFEPTAVKPFNIRIGPINTPKLRNAYYEIWIESSKSGKMKISGELIEHGIEFSLENVIWQSGYPEPSDPDNESGCNSVFGLSAPLLIILLYLTKNKGMTYTMKKGNY